jgi:hypothetical protein
MQKRKSWLLAEARNLFVESQQRIRKERGVTCYFPANEYFICSFEVVGESEDDVSAGKTTLIKLAMSASSNGKSHDANGVFYHNNLSCDFNTPIFIDMRVFASSFSEYFIGEFLKRHNISIEKWNNLLD